MKFPSARAFCALRALVLAFALLTFSTALRAQTCLNFAVAISAEIQTTPPTITLHWVRDTLARSYTISRRAFAGTDDWKLLTTGNAKDTLYLDTNVQIGQRYEYQIIKQFKSVDTTIAFEGFGYIVAGMEIPVVDRMGTLSFIVDDSVAPFLSTELTQLEQDLIADGWKIDRHDVPRHGSDTAIKTLIQNDLSVDPDMRALFVFGHVPVPYSGDIYPDGHPQHHGAWPTDLYYGNLQGDWTDNSVIDTAATNQANWNKIGDGKFDQSEPDYPMDLEVGRVDLWGMSAFSLSEVELLRQYLNKDHAFRTGSLTAPKRGIISDNFGPIDYKPYAEAFAATAWRAFPAFFGISNTTAIPGGTWFTTLDTAAYLCAYGCGGGDPTDAGGIGSTSNFAQAGSKAIFTSLFGSWFGDWNVPNDFLRAPLCTSYGLTNAWAGRPQWLYHPMALGETIGYCARLTEDSSIQYVPDVYAGLLYNAATDGEVQCYVSTELMGDPTLKLQYVQPPEILSLMTQNVGGAAVKVSWTTAHNKPIAGFYVYHSDSASGPFLRVSPQLDSSATSYIHGTPINGSNYYMIRSVELLTTASGSYYAASEGSKIVEYTFASGVAQTVQSSAATLIAHHTTNGMEFDLANPQSANVELAVYDLSGREVWHSATLLASGSTIFNWDLRKLDGSEAPSGAYFVRAIGMRSPLSTKFILTR